MPYVDPVECLALPQRRRIYDEIRNRPGRIQADLERASGLAKNTILWHVQKLEQARLIVSENYLGSRVYHAIGNGLPGKRLGRAVALLQDPRNRRIIELARDRHDAESIRKELRAAPDRIAAVIEALHLANASAASEDATWDLLLRRPGFHKVPSLA
ncbi:MAG: hypothetical protein ACYC2H_00780 [Thermoplasmatota archaeon]